MNKQLITIQTGISNTILSTRIENKNVSRTNISNYPHSTKSCKYTYEIEEYEIVAMRSLYY